MLYTDTDRELKEIFRNLTYYEQYTMAMNRITKYRR